MFNLKRHNVLDLNIKKCLARLGKNLIYVGTWDVGYGVPSAVFYRSNRKKYKDFTILSYDSLNKRFHISDRNWKDMENHRTVTAIACRNCKEFIYSAYRHHYNVCKCGESFIDGGSDYIRTNVPDVIKVDMLSKFDKKNK